MKYTEFVELEIAVLEITGNLTLTPTEIKTFLDGEGLDSDLTDIFWNSREELYTNINGSNKRTVVHICDISTWPVNADQDPKFHILNCITMKSMRKNQKEHRYKKAGRNDGQFLIITRESRNYKELDLCKNCHKIYKSNRTFILAEWMKTPIDHDPFTNQPYDITTIRSIYSPDWPRISQNIKVKAGYVCKICRICLNAPNTQRYCNVHHKDGDRTNNSLENLTPLCIECHTKQDRHGHMKNLPSYKKYMEIKGSIR